MFIRRIWAFLGVFWAGVLGAGLVWAQGVALLPGQGVTFYQLSYPAVSGGAASATGLLELELYRLRQLAALEAGYLNVATPAGWVVRNLPIQNETHFPYATLSRAFNLGVSAGTVVSSSLAEVRFSADPVTSFNVTPATSYSVVAKDIVQGGAPYSGSAAVPPPPQDLGFPSITLSSRAAGSSRLAVQMDHPNVEAAINQCMPMSVANSLQYLKDKTGLPVPHEHKPGLKGDNSLVGQLDTAMDRPVTDRQHGSGTWGLTGKLKYLAENGLANRVQTQHWGVGGDAEPNNTNVSVTSGNVTARSTGRGSLNFDQIFTALQEDQDCEMVYSWPGGAHAVDLVAAGEDNGKRWVTHASDLNQADDSKGAGASGFMQEELSDTWGINKSNATVVQVICQKALPPPTTVTVTETIDPAGHSCCVDRPPSQWLITRSGNQLSLAAATGSASWLPVSGSIGSDGSFNLSGLFTVAGFSNVNTSFTGSLQGGNMTATVVIGTRGELFGTPITYKLSGQGTAAPIRPAVRVDGFRHQVASDQAALRRLSVSLDPGDQVGQPAEYWVVAQAGGQLYSLNSQLQWTPGLTPYYAGPLAQVSYLPLPHTVLPAEIPQGSYTLYFGVDTRVNGSLDLDALSYDQLSWTVR